MCHHLAAVSPGKLFRLAVGDCRVGDLLGSVTALEIGEERTVPQAVGEMLRYCRTLDECPVEIEAHQAPFFSFHRDKSSESGCRSHRELQWNVRRNLQVATSVTGESAATAEIARIFPHNAKMLSGRYRLECNLRGSSRDASPDGQFPIWRAEPSDPCLRLEVLCSPVMVIAYSEGEADGPKADPWVTAPRVRTSEQETLEMIN